MPCLVNVNSIDTVASTAGMHCEIFITGHSKPLKSLTEYKDVLSLIEEATSHYIAKT